MSLHTLQVVLSGVNIFKNWKLVLMNSVASMQHGLKINMANAYLLRNKHVTQRPVIFGGIVIEEVPDIYLG